MSPTSWANKQVSKQLFLSITVAWVLPRGQRECCCLQGGLFVYMVVCLFITFCLFVCLFVYMVVYLFIWLFTCLFVCLFDWLFIRLFVCLFVCMFVYTVVCLFIWLFTCLFVCLLTHSFFVLLQIPGVTRVCPNLMAADWNTCVIPGNMELE